MKPDTIKPARPQGAALSTAESNHISEQLSNQAFDEGPVFADLQPLFDAQRRRIDSVLGRTKTQPAAFRPRRSRVGVNIALYGVAAILILVIVANAPAQAAKPDASSIQNLTYIINHI